MDTENALICSVIPHIVVVVPWIQLCMLKQMLFYVCCQAGSGVGVRVSGCGHVAAPV